MTRLFSVTAAALLLASATSNAFAAQRGGKAPPRNVAHRTNAGYGAWSDPTRMQVYVAGRGLEWVTIDGRQDLDN